MKLKPQILTTKSTLKKTYQVKLEIPPNSQNTVYSYVKKLQTESLALLKQPIVINTAIAVVKRETGRIRPSILRKELKGKVNGHGANLHESTYTYALAAAKGYLFNLEMADEMLHSMNEKRLTEFIYFGRSPGLEQVLADQFDIRKTHARNFILGARRKLPSYPFQYMADLDLKVADAINQLLIKSTLWPKSLDFLEGVNSEKLTEHLQLFFSEVHSNPWATLRRLATDYFAGNYYPIFAIVIEILAVGFSFALPKEEDLVVKPYTGSNHNNNDRAPSIQLVMAKKYVVYREGSASELTDLAIKRGYLELIFPTGKGQVTTRLIVHDKILEYLNNGAMIINIEVQTSVDVAIINVRTEATPKKKVMAKLVLSGSKQAFASYKQVLGYVAKMKVKAQEDVIGVDINRMGVNAISFSADVRLPKGLQRTLHTQSTALKTYTSLLNKTEQLPDSKFKSQKLSKLRGEIERHYSRKVRVRRSLHQSYPLFIAAVLIAYQAKKLAIENLHLTGRGTKGNLARAYYSMPDEINIYEKAVMIAAHELGYEVELVKVNPKNTSRKHFNCSGYLERDESNWDYATCLVCQIRVNTHKNAALNIRERAL